MAGARVWGKERKEGAILYLILLNVWLFLLLLLLLATWMALPALNLKSLEGAALSWVWLF